MNVAVWVCLAIGAVIAILFKILIMSNLDACDDAIEGLFDVNKELINTVYTQIEAGDTQDRINVRLLGSMKEMSSQIDDLWECVALLKDVMQEECMEEEVDV